jgi:hypothetical protein
MLKIDGKGKKILIIPDQHIPYHNPKMRRFLINIKNNFKPDIIINLGDMEDNHAISFHDSDSELLSAGDELKKTIEYIQNDLYSVFPKMYILDSNHGSLVYRKMKHHGIPIAYIKPLKEIYGTPEWQWVPELILETKLGPVYFTHGKSAAPMKVALAMGMSTVQGHHHQNFRINWAKFADDRIIFDMISGCLIDPDSDAFAYGKNGIGKPMLGCSVIHANGVPQLIPLL